MTTTLNALVSDGSLANRAALSDFGHLRAGVVAWTVAMPFRVDSLTPGEDGQLWSMRRVAGAGRNHGGRFDDNSNRLAVTYNTAETAGTGTDTVPATTWVLGTWTHSGTGTTVIGRLFSMADGSQIGSDANGTASSLYDDGQTQEMTLMAEYNGTATSLELRGRIVPPLIVRGAALSSSRLGELAADYLNVGDELVAEYDGVGGATVVFIDDSGIDQGSGGETVTLSGAVAWGSANGPTVPDRTVPSADVVIDDVGDFGVVFVGEQRIVITGSGFGTEPPIVTLSTSALSSTGEALTVEANSATELTVSIPTTVTITGPAYLWVTNQTPGAEFGTADAQLIQVLADPGASVVAQRTAPPAINMQASTALNVPTATYFYLRSAQEVLTYSVAAGSLPTGVSLNSSTGVAAGTIDSGAASGSPFSAVIRATDENGSYAEVLLSWVISVVVATTRAVGSWGRRAR